MSTLIVAVLAFVGYIIAYNTYGRWLSKKVFRLASDAPVPSEELRDDQDYVPTNRWVLFGHHFTSIAGTGPIVGPAIAVLWGWLPALLWVLFGAIFIGAVHDFTALVISTRSKGQTIGDVAGDVISPRARLVFLVVLAFALMVVIGVFGLVIATIFDLYPQSVLPVWITLPLAVFVGFAVNRRGGSLLIPAIVTLLLVYASVWVGCEWPFKLDAIESLGVWGTPKVVWTVILLIYCYVASVLPVWMLLQPRDFVNSLQLFVALAVMMAGLGVASCMNKADLFETAPAIASSETVPSDAPPIWPFLFITVACGAVSGFHSLVSSGTSSKQIARETDAQMVGYGGMLMEGALAVIVILACCAGLGMGITVERPIVAAPTPVVASSDGVEAAEVPMETVTLTGREAWESRYGGESWSAMNLPRLLAAFVDGGANFIAATGIPFQFAVGLVAVLAASFAATTLDTATRLQRYLVQEIATSCRVAPLANKYVATAIAVGTGGFMALMPGPKGELGTGGLILWPLFGTVNQLVAGLALMVGVFYLMQRRMKSWPLIAPTIFMLIFPAWAMIWNLLNKGWHKSTSHVHLFAISIAILLLEAWIIVEAYLAYRRIQRGEGVETLPVDGVEPPGE